LPLSISSDAIVEKNKLSSSDVWLLLLKIEYPGEDPGHVCLNNESIVWNGNTWLPAIFKLSDLKETKDAEIPSVKLTVMDLQRNILPYIDRHNGGVGATITIYVVHSAHLDNTTPELEEEMEVLSVKIDQNIKITFELGAENLLKLRIPKHRYFKNFCRFIFKSSRCGYSGAETECNRTLARCKELGNETRYGGFPGVGTAGVMK